LCCCKSAEFIHKEITDGIIRAVLHEFAAKNSQQQQRIAATAKNHL
jgi:hypothetical protein